MSSLLPIDLGQNGATPEPDPGAPPVRSQIFPKIKKRRLQIDDEMVVLSVLARARELGEDADRDKWLTDRLNRYAKYRGWLTEKTYPWASCSNVHLPLLSIGELRQNAGLHNVVMTQRPLMSAKATQRSNIDRERAITDLLDAQLFLEPGPDLAERRLGDFISNFLQDTNAVAYTPWVRAESRSVLVRYVPAPPQGVSLIDYLPQKFSSWFPTMVGEPALHETLDSRFYISFKDGEVTREAQIDVAEDDDGSFECVIDKPTTIYDGPVMLPIDPDSLLIPTRCTNLQPPSAWNPDGAPYVFLIVTYRLDEIRRLKEAGDFNWLDDEGLEQIETAARTAGGLAAPDRPGEELEAQKDLIEGREHREVPLTAEEDDGHLAVDLYLCFDRWDVDGDGLSEDAFWVVARDAKVLCEARLLTERWPADRPYRPLAEATAIPVPGRWYGISPLELGESLYDLIKGTFDQAYDGWTMATMPWFFYGASSKLNEDITSIAPGQGVRIPGNPKDSVLFPNLPQRDVAGAMGLIGLAMQFFERVMPQSGALQQGMVPQGKASALRTFGTTSALLQQGDVRADQMLIRLFGGLRQVAANYHRMNRHFLPPGKEVRIVGWDGAAEQGYRAVEVDDIDAEMDFDFRPDFLLSNPEMLSQAIQSVMAVVVTPLVFQMGIATPANAYRLLKDYIRSRRLDPKLYVMPPPPGKEPVLAADAIAQIRAGRLPDGVPQEGPERHLKTLTDWASSPEYLLQPPHTMQLAAAWMQTVMSLLQQQKMAGQAAQFQQQMAQGQPGAAGSGGTPPSAHPVGVGDGAPAPAAPPTQPGAPPGA